MQNAQNTFYLTLRDRLAALNPNRSIYLRGVTRPGILVESNELVKTQPPSDSFVMRWIELHSDPYLPAELLQIQCEIAYKTEGTTGSLGMDRGTILAEMDMELLSILRPGNVQKMNYGQSPATQMATRIFWADATFDPVEVERDRLRRAARVSVFAYQEAGEE